MKLAISICVLVFVCTFISAEDTEWDNFKFKLSKSFRNKGEEDSHRSNFLKRTQSFAEHNKKYAAGEVSYKLGPNKYSDLSFADAQRYLCGLKIETPEQLAASPHLIPSGSSLRKDSNEPLPESIDWREKGVVTAVKDQGSCGSCYAFSSVGALEAVYCKQYKTGPTSLSPQNLVDCSRDHGNYGCNGGFMATSFEYVIENGGLNAEVVYPYKGKEQECAHNHTYNVLKLNGFVQAKSNDAEDIKRLVANGPVSVAIAAGTGCFMNYAGGILDDTACGTGLNHAVLITGYGTEDGKDYWTVKNSWGNSWGEDGYVRVARGKNQCGVELQAFQPTIE